MITDCPDLVEYGIHLEKSDIRVHIGVIARRAFIFRTADAIAVIRSEKLEERDASQPGANGRTARGYIMPLGLLHRMKSIGVSTWPQFDGWTDTLSTTEKGNRAVDVVKGLLKRGCFPLWIDCDEDDRENIQISGTDILIFARKRIQVKCDYRAGLRSIPGCTGNLFLQTHERNPFKRH